MNKNKIVRRADGIFFSTERELKIKRAMLEKDQAHEDTPCVWKRRYDDLVYEHSHCHLIRNGKMEAAIQNLKNKMALLRYFADCKLFTTPVIQSGELLVKESQLHLLLSDSETEGTESPLALSSTMIHLTLFEREKRSFDSIEALLGAIKQSRADAIEEKKKIISLLPQILSTSLHSRLTELSERLWMEDPKISIKLEILINSKKDIKEKFTQKRWSSPSKASNNKPVELSSITFPLSDIQQLLSILRHIKTGTTEPTKFNENSNSNSTNPAPLVGQK